MPNNDFSLKNLPNEAQDNSIVAGDFKLVDSSNRVHEQKFQTRPTTFFKDSIKRFMKNKSSVVAAAILGVLLLMAVIVPIVDPYEVHSENASYMTYLEPKLFEAGTGFWDGTKKWERIPTYIPNVSGTDELDMNKENWWPNPKRFKKNAVSNKQFSDFTYTSGQSEYGRGGYIQFGFNSRTEEDEVIYYRTRPFSQTISVTDDISLKTFETFDLDKLIATEGNKKGVTIPENYEIGEIELYFCYRNSTTNTDEYVKLLEPKKVYSIGSSEAAVNLTDKIRTATGLTSFDKGFFEFRLVNEGPRKNTCALIKSIEFAVNSSNATLVSQITAANFTDATSNILRESKIDNAYNHAYWENNGVNGIHMSKIVYCTFSYDSYEGVFGTMDKYGFEEQYMKTYAKNKWIEWDVWTEKVNGTYVVKGDWGIKNKDKSPVKEIYSVTCSSNGEFIYANVKLCYYQFYSYDSMPKFLMGTDKDGNVMFRYVFEGLLTSLLLGIGTFLVCFLFGLCYGSIAGYFGGTVDLVMERFTDILSGVPWIVVMTLAIIKYGSNIMTFAMALCLTGWIGTAATTRTQFYRFRSREYVLASRTLGASDARLISKHILPNAMGTIITSAVLMIPSVIFSEASISYLGLGLKDQSSLGVILSNNQGELTSNPYLLIFPSVVIALLMISFNLFGNGLRDAVNPSLKGEE